MYGTAFAPALDQDPAARAARTLRDQVNPYTDPLQDG
jgi:hypothetical protein